VDLHPRANERGSQHKDVFDTEAQRHGDIFG
jgi:hypothetical protein